jgi:3-dehydroquinate dehydratase
MIGPEVSGTIIGFGAEGYLMALRTAIDRHVKGINFL